MTARRIGKSAGTPDPSDIVGDAVDLDGCAMRALTDPMTPSCVAAFLASRFR